MASETVRLVLFTLLGCFSFSLFCLWVISWIRDEVMKEVWATLCRTCGGGILVTLGLLLIHYGHRLVTGFMEDPLHVYAFKFITYLMGAMWIFIGIVIWLKQVQEFKKDIQWAFNYKKEHYDKGTTDRHPVKKDRNRE